MAVERKVHLYLFSNKPEFNVGSRGGVVSIFTCWEVTHADILAKRIAAAVAQGYDWQLRDAGITQRIPTD